MGGGAPINKSRRRRSQIVGGGTAGARLYQRMWLPGQDLCDIICYSCCPMSVVSVVLFVTLLLRNIKRQLLNHVCLACRLLGSDLSVTVSLSLASSQHATISP